MNKSFIAALAVTVAFASCKSGEEKKDTSAKPDILKTNLDTTINPADDFFKYANGGWIKMNPIPGDQTSWGIAGVIQDTLFNRLLKINEEALAKKSTKGTDQQIGDFWYSGMDTNAIEKAGIEPLREELNKISAIQTPADVMSVAAHLHTFGVGVFFGEGVAQDAKNSEVNAYYMQQGGLGLPNRDYYFNTDGRTTKIRNEYPNYIAKIFTLMGVSEADAQAKAKAIVALETRLAKSSRKLEALRDPYANYNKMAIAQLNKMAPRTDWPKYLQLIGVHSVDSVIVGQPEFYKELDAVVNTENSQTLKDYLTFHLVSAFADHLSSPFVNADFDFYNKTIRGQKEQKPRWKRILTAEEGAMGEALGQLFVKEYFNEKAKKRYEEIVENVRAAYKVRIEKLDWMSDSTKQKALQKLAAIKSKVGYPDKWKDFSSLQIDRGPFVLNIIRANKWWNDYYLAKLGKPVDRNEWDMTPQTYNAYYNPSNNEIVLPAGIFTVPGYMDHELDDALVYGYAAASTVGHEITHGFDDEGRQFDAAGNLQNWWNKKDEEEFTRRADILVKQFNNFMPIDTQRINGKATLGENLADLGGISSALMHLR